MSSRFAAFVLPVMLVLPWSLGCDEEAPDEAPAATAPGAATPAKPEESKPAAAPEVAEEPAPATAEEPATAKNHATPEAVFKAAQGAAAARDYTAFIDCIHPASRADLAAAAFVLLRSAAPKDKNAMKRIAAFNKENGVPNPQQQKKWKGGKKKKRELLKKSFKDPKGYFVASMALIDELHAASAAKKKQPVPGAAEHFFAGDLAKPKITGDKAAAQITKKAKKSKPKKVKFERVDGSWAIVPALGG